MRRASSPSEVCDGRSRCPRSTGKCLRFNTSFEGPHLQGGWVRSGTYKIGVRARWRIFIGIPNGAALLFDIEAAQVSLCFQPFQMMRRPRIQEIRMRGGFEKSGLSLGSHHWVEFDTRELAFFRPNHAVIPITSFEYSRIAHPAG